MNTINLPVITSTNPIEIKKIFCKVYLNKEMFFEGIKIVIFEEDFNHICYESGEQSEYKSKFSLRRARKLLAIKGLCEGDIPYILIHQINRQNKSICVLAESIELAMYLVPQPSSEGLFFRLGTIIVFGKDVEKRIRKQKESGEIIKNVQEALSNENEVD